MVIKKESNTKQNRTVLIYYKDKDLKKNLSVTLQQDNYIIKECCDFSKILNEIQNFNPDILILENEDNNDLIQSLMEKIHKKDNYIAIILLATNPTSEKISKGLDLGADDYISKSISQTEFLARLRSQLRIKDLTDDLKMANKKLKELANTDDLTELFNMRSLYSRLDHELERAKRFNRSVCAVMMDMDYFKKVNDNHDHLFGSFVLKEVGKIIKNNIRTIDFAARYGGDEFLIILTEVNAEGALKFCERLREKIEKYKFEKNQDKMYLTASLGFCVIEPKNYHIDAQALVRSADKALYTAKASGRNCTKMANIVDAL